MSIRMTGLTSGLDTDTVVQALMSAQRMKLTKVENKKQKLEWKQDLWSSVNSKVYKFYSGTLSSARLQTTYNTKKATSSDSSKVSVTASSTASEGTYKVKVNQLASAQYVTSAKVEAQDGSSVTTSTKLVGLGSDEDGGVAAGTQITITGADKSYVLTVDENTTVSDFVTACQNAGLTASFDTTQQRFFISSSTSGEDQSFTITASTMSEGQSNAIQAWKDAIGYDYLSSSDQTKVTKIFSDLQLGNITEEEAMESLESYVETAKANATSSYYSNLLTEKVTASVNTEYESYYAYDPETGEITGLSYAGKMYYEEVMTAEAEESEEAEGTGETTGEEEEEVTGPTDEEMLAAVQSWQSAAISDGIAEAKASEDYVTAVETAAVNGITADGVEGFLSTSVEADMATLTTIVSGTTDETTGETTGGYKDVMTTGTDSADLSGLGLATVTGETVSEDTGVGMAVIQATDASVTVNGATLTSSDNTITMNGLTMDLVDVTDSEVTITVSKDTSAVYDTIKDFINEYNEILTMLNGYYYADSARDYDVLTDDEKEAMSDDEIEKWENKIKDSLLRNDDYINTIINTMKNCMMATYTASDGNTYSLASLGITTSSDYTEKGLLHIQGDADDSEYADYDNKLEAMIESDPDLVAEIMTGLTGAMYDQMYEISKSSTYSSVYTFYNDKEMESQLSDYKKEISDWETKLANLEDRYYSQFTAMETALAKLNSQSTYINALLGS